MAGLLDTELGAEIGGTVADAHQDGFESSGGQMEEYGCVLKENSILQNRVLNHD